MTSAAALRSRLTNSDNGLEIRRWVTRDPAADVGQALASHAAGQPVDDQALARLKRNGFRLIRVKVDEVDSLLDALGGASYDATEWHGQVYRWRSIVEKPVDLQGQAVAVDGFVRSFQGCDFRLVIRAWTVQMEDDPVVHLELLPQRSIPQVNNLRRLLGDERDAQEGFAAVALDLPLEAGFAYVLAGESPQSDWPGVDGGESAPQPSRKRSSRLDFGPDAAAVPTLGELLLPIQSDPPSRTMLVFIPKISSDLFLPEQVAAHAQESKGSGS